MRTRSFFHLADKQSDHNRRPDSELVTVRVQILAIPDSPQRFGDPPTPKYRDTSLQVLSGASLLLEASGPWDAFRLEVTQDRPVYTLTRFPPSSTVRLCSGYSGGYPSIALALNN